MDNFGMNFSAVELRQITDWDERVIEDYLAITRTLGSIPTPNPPIVPATKTKITYDAYGYVTAGADATTADINDSLNRRYVTDAQLVVINNTSGTNTGDQNVFSTIAVSGQSNVVADSPTDTLTLVAGANITITTDAGADSITINSAETLQTAYVNGNTITNTNADGSLVIDPTGVGVTVPPLRIVPDSTFPSTGLAGGAINLDTDGTMYVYDSTRSKFLSVAEVAYHFANNGNTDNQFLRVQGITNTGVGYRMPRDGTIEAIKAEGGGVLTKAFEVFVNGSSVISFSLSGGLFTDLAENENFSAGDYIQVFVSAALGNVTDPLVSLYVKWRK